MKSPDYRSPDDKNDLDVRVTHLIELLDTATEREKQLAGRTAEDDELERAVGELAEGVRGDAGLLTSDQRQAIYSTVVTFLRVADVHHPLQAQLEVIRKALAE